MDINKKIEEYSPSDFRLAFLIGISLCLIIFAAYWQVTDLQFVYDDIAYITGNRHIQNGLTKENFQWALTAEVAGNWHPLTLLSHMLDCQLHGLNPGRHHITNLLFHLANTLLLFLVLYRMTNALWQSAVVAALFAIHPLHVESVAWVSERKDVLSTFFWILTMWVYIRYVQAPGIYRYLYVIICLILGLMAKPMLVTLPFVLLLMDYWPLKRFQLGQPTDWHLILEKVPLFVIVAASCVVTVHYQQIVGAVGSYERYPILLRLANAVISYAIYIINMFWPFKLAVIYPYFADRPWWQMAGTCLFILCVTFYSFKNMTRHPYIAVGWLWYIGSLVPVIGIVQVGTQSMADRYTYVPLIGIFIIIAWGAPQLIARWQHKKIGLAIVAGALFFILTAITHLQVRHWTNNSELFEHALKVTTNNTVAHNNLGNTFAIQGRMTEAIQHFSEALKIDPQHAIAHNNMGRALLAQGRLDEAIKYFNEALRINPDYETAHLNMGSALKQCGRNEKAHRHYAAGLRINPDNPETHFLLGDIMLGKGQIQNAVFHFKEALRINPGLREAHVNVGYALQRQGKEHEAEKHYLEAIRLDPKKSIAAYYNMACVQAKRNKIQESVDWLKKAIDKGFDNWELLKTDDDLESIRTSSYYIELRNSIQSIIDAPRDED